MVKKMSEEIDCKIKNKNMSLEIETIGKDNVKEFEKLLKEDFKKRFKRRKYS